MSPSVSRKQHGFMALVKNYKETGKMPPIDNSDVEKKVKEASDGLSMSKIRDFLKTKVKNLPDYVVDKKTLGLDKQKKVE